MNTQEVILEKPKKWKIAHLLVVALHMQVKLKIRWTGTYVATGTRNTQSYIIFYLNSEFNFHS